MAVDPDTKKAALEALDAIEQYEREWLSHGVDRVHLHFSEVEGDWLDTFKASDSDQVELNSSPMPQEKQPQQAVAVSPATNPSHWPKGFLDRFVKTHFIRKYWQLASATVGGLLVFSFGLSNLPFTINTIEKLLPRPTTTPKVIELPSNAPTP